MSMTDYGPPRVTLARLKSMAHVIHALMLRDIRTRMLGSAYGYFIVILWPMSHVLLLVALHAYRGSGPPYGDNAILWAACGVVPYLCFSYVARFTVLGVAVNKPLLFFPKISPLTLILSRAIIEVLNSTIVVLCMLAIMYTLDVDVMPRDPIQACYAILGAWLLGLGYGMLNCVIVGRYPAYMTAFVLTLLALWVSSGVFFVPSAMPERLRLVLSYNPVVHVVEWMRVAYFDSYPTLILDRGYLLAWGVGLVFVSLVAERAMRGSLATG